MCFFQNVNAMRMDLSTLLVTTEAESVPAIPTLLEINVPNVPLNILHFPLVMVSNISLFHLYFLEISIVQRLKNSRLQSLEISKN
jgi:hypothetical protein